jgi:hypothetical protein
MKLRISWKPHSLFLIVEQNILNILIRDVGLSNVANMLNYIFISALILYFIIYLIHCYQYLVFPYQLDYVEGYLLSFADKISHGENIYNDISRYPYIPGLYPPIYPWVLSPFVKLFGFSFAIGRTFSVISALLTGFFIYKILELKAGRRAALVGSLLFFASPYVFYTTTLFRVDALGLLFSIIGIWFVIKYENKTAVYLSVPFFILSVFTKQSYLAAPASYFLFLFLKNRLEAIKFAGLFIISTLLLFFLINHLTKGQFYLHMLAYQGLTPVLRLVFQRYGLFLQSHTIEFLLALIPAIYLAVQKRWKLFSIYFLIAALAALTVGRPGANINYFLELIAVCGILSALVYKTLQPQINKGSLGGILIMVALLSQVALFSHGPFESLDKKTNANNRVSAMIRSTEGEILSEDAGLALLNGKTVWIEWALDTQLYMLGLWDQSNFVSELQDKRFSLIILEKDANVALRLLILNKNNPQLKSVEDIAFYQRYTIEMLDAIVTNYHLVDKLEDFYVYSPNK